MTLVMNQLLEYKLTETDIEEEKDNQSTEKQEEISETNVTTRSQGLVKEDNSILPKIKKLQENMKKVQKNTTTNKIPEFTITSQDPKRINMPNKPIEDKVDNVKKNIKAPEMGYDIVEDIKKAKENMSLLEMCNVPQRKEKLLKSLEAPEE